MTVQGDNPDKRTDAAELAAIQRNAVTVPADKLAELQRKAKLVDELVEALEDILSIVDIHSRSTNNNFAWAEKHFARLVLAKAKGE